MEGARFGRHPLSTYASVGTPFKGDATVVLLEINFWNLFWLFAIFLPLLFLWAFGLVDVFRRKDLSGIAKVIWVILILWLPILGVLIYFLSRPAHADVVTESHIDPNFSVADELDKLSALHDQGKLSDEEWEIQKTRLLGSGKY
jgi:hypothetical protein